MRRRTHVPCVVDVPRPSAAPTRMVQYRPLVGEDAPLDAATALAMRLPASGPSGHPWHFSRAELPHSLPSELRAARGGERMTLASYVEHLIRLLDPKLKGTPGRPPRRCDVPAENQFKRRSQRQFGLSSSARSARRRVGWLLAAPQHRGVLRAVGCRSIHSTVRNKGCNLVKNRLPG